MLRIVVAEAGLAGHDRGLDVLARALRDAGCEVIHAGLARAPELVAETAIQEDADLVGLVGVVGLGVANLSLLERLTGLLRERGAEDVVVFVQGTVSEEDQPALARLGVARVFAPGEPVSQIVDWVAAEFPED